MVSSPSTPVVARPNWVVPGVGPPGHPHLAVGPVCLNGDVAGLVRIGNPLAVEPLNHALERVDLPGRSRRFQSPLSPWCPGRRTHPTQAPDQIIVVPRQVLIVIHLLVGVVIIPVRGICLGCCLGRGGGSRRLPRCGLAVHLVQVIAVLAIGRLSRGTAR